MDNNGLVKIYSARLSTGMILFIINVVYSREYIYYLTEFVLRCAKWVQNLRRADLTGKSPDDLKHRRVCAEHFESSQFMNANER